MSIILEDRLMNKMIAMHLNDFIKTSFAHACFQLSVNPDINVVEEMKEQLMYNMDNAHSTFVTVLLERYPLEELLDTIIQQLVTTGGLVEESKYPGMFYMNGYNVYGVQVEKGYAQLKQYSDTYCIPITLDYIDKVGTEIANKLKHKTFQDPSVYGQAILSEVEAGYPALHKDFYSDPSLQQRKMQIVMDTVAQKIQEYKSKNPLIIPQQGIRKLEVVKH